MSENQFEKQIKASKVWADEACNLGWLSPEDLIGLDALQNRSPSMLFDGLHHRPLVVAFFGGTGVGKSSLLNCLAKQDIARTGIERPTSREISIYMHESMQIKHLPKDFPVAKVRSAYHRDERLKQVLWIDMPDIDSTEIGNRNQVLDWLPHIDVLIYVVNPERYRDDKGWKMLLDNCAQHAWLFVFNQWDRGCIEQWQDFERLLNQGGFIHPLMFKTICKSEATEDFQALQETIRSLSDDHVISQLETRALDAQRQELQDRLSDCFQKIGDSEALEALKGRWIDIWKETEITLKKGLEWPIKEIAKSYLSHESNPLLKSVKLDSPMKDAERSSLWDDWAHMQLQDALNRLLIETDAKLPSSIIKSRLNTINALAAKKVTQQTQLSLRQALANPGNAVQRKLLKFASFCAIFLPLIAMGWVSYRVVSAYYWIALNQGDYLGTQFAIHSTLLIAISWLLPFFIAQKLKPSAERAALDGLKQGLESSFANLEAEVLTILDQINLDAQRQIDSGKKILATFNPESLNIKPDTLLDRMLSKNMPSNNFPK